MKKLATRALLLLASTTAFSEDMFSNGFFPDLQFEGKGHFYLTEHDGRSLFVTPEGTGFYPIGINHLDMAFKGHGSESALPEPSQAEEILRNMVDWGFNCGGYGLSPSALGEEIYFIGNLNFVHQGFYRLHHARFPDVFDASFEASVERTQKQAAARLGHPERLIGMVWSDLPSWNIFKSRMLRQTDWVTEIRNLDSSAPGKKRYLDFLRKRYENNTENFKQYYRLSDTDVADLEHYDFTRLYLGHPMIMEDDQLFMAEIAERYYSLGSKYHDQYFPNVPLLGDRFLLGDHPDAVLEVAAKYVDAISIQIGDGYGETMLPSYPFPKDTIEHIHGVTGKPLLIADHQISFYTDDYKGTIFSQAGNQQQASLETRKFLEAAFAVEYVCGYFRCTYLTKDEPNGRGVKQGLVDFEGTPFPEMTEAYRSMNWKIEEFVR
jgi:hypothetical protein